MNVIHNIKRFNPKFIEALIQHHRTRGNRPMPPMVRKYITYVDGKYSKTRTVKTRYRMTSNEYADLLQLEMLMLKD